MAIKQALAVKTMEAAAGGKVVSASMSEVTNGWVALVIKQALMRRNSGLASQVISLPPFQVDLSRRELSINDEVIKLTAFEYTIMETLIRNNGKVVSKDSLMLQLYPDAELRESHTIDVLMGRLRKKIQAQYPQEVITTVRGQGYLFELR